MPLAKSRIAFIRDGEDLIRLDLFQKDSTSDQLIRSLGIYAEKITYMRTEYTFMGTEKGVDRT